MGGRGGRLGRLLGVAAGPTVALLAAAAVAAGATRISVGTGSAGGVYFFVGTALTTLLNKHIPGMNATPEPVTGSAHALKLLHAGDLTIALVELGSAYFGVRGQREFDRKYDQVGFVMAGMDTGQSLVTWAEGPIRSFGDVRGKRLASNSPASRAQLLAVLRLYGIAEGDVQHKYLNYSEQMAALRDGSIDAGFFAVSPRNANVMDLASGRGVRILGLDPARARAFAESYPYWTPTTIRAGTYPRQDEDLLVPALYTTLLAHRGADPALVYEIVRTVIERGREFGELHPGGREFTIDKTRHFVERNLLPVGFHPGAERFWREKGVVK